MEAKHTHFSLEQIQLVEVKALVLFLDDYTNGAEPF
jgi:hypothetical protein